MNCHSSGGRRSFESELAEACAPSNLNLGLLPWSAMAGGALSGKYQATSLAGKGEGAPSSTGAWAIPPHQTELASCAFRRCRDRAQLADGTLAPALQAVHQPQGPRGG